MLLLEVAMLMETGAKNFSREKTFADDPFWNISREETFADGPFWKISRKKLSRKGQKTAKPRKFLPLK